MSDTSNGVPTSNRIIVGVDGSDHSKQALHEAARLAHALNVPLEAVTCWQDPTMHGGAYGYIPDIDPDAFRTNSEKILKHTLYEVFGPDRPNHLSTRQLHGRPAEALIEESKNAQMIVVGARGVGGVLGSVLGSVSSAVVSHGHCPVLVVRGPHTTEAGQHSKTGNSSTRAAQSRSTT